MTAAVLVAADGDLPDIPGQPYVSPDDLASIGPLWQQAVQQQLVPIVAEVYQTSAGVVHAQMVDATQVPTLPSVGSLAAEQYLAAATNTFEQVGDDLWATARSEMLDGFEKGESIDQLAARLRASAGMTAKKAVLVARTQVLDASNAGSIATARATGIDMQKEWMSAEDLRVRPEHVLANGQKVDLNAKFTVGGYECDRPHDPTLPPALRYSCRCTTGYLIPEAAVDEAVDDARPVPPIPGTSGVVEPLPDPYAGDLVSPALPGPQAGVPIVPAGGLTVRPVLEAARTTSAVSRVFTDEYIRITGRTPGRGESFRFEGSAATAREHAEGLLLGLERFPDAQLRGVGPYSISRDSIEYAFQQGDRINFNYHWTVPAARKQYLDSIRSDEASRWHVPGSGNPAAVALHEFGHVLDTSSDVFKRDLDGLLARSAAARDADLATARAAGELVDPEDFAAGSGVDGLIRRQVSSYGTKNRQELVAEAFTDVMINGDRASDLSKDIFTLLEAEYRRGGGIIRSAGPEVALPSLPSPTAGLAARTVPQLRALAKERGITIPPGSKKADIVRLLDEGPPGPTATPGGLLTPAEFDARATAALDGAQDEAAIPVHARITAPGSEPSTWRATGFNGAAADPEAVKAVTQYLRRPGAVNERLRFPDDPTHPLHEQTLDELLGYEPANPTLVAEAAARADAQIAAIDRVMSQSLMPSESVTWRGVSMRALGDVPTDLVGYEWTDLGFVSTSTTRSVAENSFAGSGALLRIVVPEGTQALGFTGLGEAEMLLGRGLRYRIVADRGLTSEGARLLDVEIVPTGAAPAPVVEVPLAKRTVAQLRALAADRKITVPKGAKKPDIVRLLEAPPLTEAEQRAAVRALARETNTLIEQTSATARALAEVDELLAKKASASTIREAIADALVEPGQLFAGADPAVLAALRAVASDPVKLRAAITRLGGKAKIKPVSKAGAKVTFDADTMEGVGGIDIPAGARVTVVRRGSTVTLPDGTVMQLEKARVTPVTTPVKAPAVKRVPAATKEPDATLLVRPSLANAKTVPDVATAFRTEAARLTGGRRVNFNPGPNASVDTAREHAEGVLRGLEVFPGTPPPAVASVSRNLHPDSFFAATNPGEGIRFSDEVTSAAGRAEYLRAIREGRDSGFFVPGTDSPVAVAIHEFGHVVDNRLNKVAHARVDRAVKEYAARTGIPVSTAKREISGYATEGTAELIAEAFADVILNGGSAKPLSKEIFEILRAEYSRRGLKLGRSLDLTPPRVTPVTAPVKAAKAVPVKRAPAAKKAPATPPPVKAVPRGATPRPRPVAYQLPPGVTEQDAAELRLALKRRQPIEGMPGADNAGLVERLAVENNADRVLGTFQDIVDPSRRMSTAQLQADLAARAKAAFADRAVAINVDNARLEEILTGGRFKTQFETGRSGGVFQPEERRLREEQWFGIPADAAPETRPIYGYLVTSGDGKGLVDVYGGARIVFRTDVRERTTAMVGDSMEHILTGRPAAVDNPDWYAFTIQYEDPTFAKLDRNYDGPAFNKKAYIEAQIHGGVTVDDIAEVIFTTRPSPELVALLRERGIPWRMRRR